MHGLEDAPVGVADDETDTRQAALEEPPHEARPGVALVVAGGEIEAQHPPFARDRHADRERHAIDTTRPASRTFTE